MAEDIDFNDAIDDIFLSEESKHQESYDEGFSAGCEGGNPEGFHLGYHRGAEIGRELGHYLGIVTHHLTLPESTSTTYSDKIIRQLQKVKELIDAFPKTNSEEHDILQMLGTVRAQYKKACALLKIPSSNPYGEGTISQSKMDQATIKLRKKLDSITSYLTPLLPMANCHMVEFITENHWETFVPEPLRKDLEAVGIDEAVNQFWMAAEGSQSEATSSNLREFVSKARSHCIPVDNDLCLSVDAVKRRIKLWGGDVAPEIWVTEFMSSKKGYEVRTMSSLVASLFSITHSSHIVDVGGGRGQLPAVLELGYRVPGLTVDCDRQALDSGVRRDRLIRKQWHAISKKLPHESNTRDSKEAEPTPVNRLSPILGKKTETHQVPNEKKCANKMAELTHENETNKCDSKEAGLSHTTNKCETKAAEPNHVTCKCDSKEAELHRYLQQFVTEETDLCKMVRCSFPEYGAEMKLLLTGLHTCGDLGPTSLRLFLRNPETTAAVLTVPCCYHLLSEKCGPEDGSGFPMSDHLRGYQLGRNARMLAAQSLDRVVSLRQSPARSLFYRALLQVIIKKHLPSSTIPEGRLKRIPAKFQHFSEYVKAADAILKLNLYDRLEVTYLTEFDRQYDREWRRMVLFYLLRMCLAQVIESVILLDRLLFLKENGLEKAFLVKLFDPVISPRCHGILSVT